MLPRIRQYLRPPRPVVSTDPNEAQRGSAALEGDPGYRNHYHLWQSDSRSTRLDITQVVLEGCRFIVSLGILGNDISWRRMRNRRNGFFVVFRRTLVIVHSIYRFRFVEAANQMGVRSRDKIDRTLCLMTPFEARGTVVSDNVGETYALRVILGDSSTRNDYTHPTSRCRLRQID